jgi:1,4-dihydroxy-2-naphthoyl-CoA synthase
VVDVSGTGTDTSSTTLMPCGCAFHTTEEGQNISGNYVAVCSVHARHPTYQEFRAASEMGARRAKEFLFTGMAINASQALEWGMVNRVVPRRDLEAATLDLAVEVARRPAFGLKISKLAVNQALDAQGQLNALQTSFNLHQLGHAKALLKTGSKTDPAGA